MFNRLEWLSIQAGLGTVLVQSPYLHELTTDERKEVLAMMERGRAMTHGEEDEDHIERTALLSVLRKVDSKLKEIQDGANEQAA